MPMYLALAWPRLFTLPHGPGYWPEFKIEHEVNLGLGFTRVESIISGGDFQPTKYHEKNYTVGGLLSALLLV